MSARIVHITSVHWARDIRIFQKECRSLAEAGFDVTLVAPHDRSEVIDGVRIVPIAHASGRLRRMLSTARNAADRAADLSADLYHLHDPELLFWSGRLGRRGAPVVFDMHEDLPCQIKTKSWIPALLRPSLSHLSAWLEKRKLASSPVVLAESSYARSRPWLERYVEVLNYPRLEWLADIGDGDLNPNHPRVGYLGTVTRSRGCLVTLDALGLLRSRGMRIGYDCVGPIDADLAAAARQKASGLGIGSDLNLPGRLAARDAWRIIAGCQVGLALLAPIPNYIESFPTKMFEYMALGIPVIVSDFPAYRAVIEKWDCGLVVDPTDPEAIAKALESLLANPDRRHSMGVRGSQAALDHYSWKSEERKLIDFYGQLLGLRNPANGSGRAR